MKIWFFWDLIISILFIFASVACVTCSSIVSNSIRKNDFVISADPIDKDRINIKDERGNRVGYIKKDPLIRGRMNVYGSDGTLKGVIRRDVLVKDSLRFERR